MKIIKDLSQLRNVSPGGSKYEHAVFVYNKNSVGPAAIGVSDGIIQSVDEYGKIDLFLVPQPRRVLRSLFEGGGLEDVFSGVGFLGVN